MMRRLLQLRASVSVRTTLVAILLLLSACQYRQDASSTARVPARQAVSLTPTDSMCLATRVMPAETPYLLPFAMGRSYRLSNANCSTTTHSGRTPFRYAFDFAMPMGDTVVASREGRVLSVEEGNPDGTRLAGDENFVMILHQDRTIGRYIHIMKNGALVDSGESVKRGQPIALSGNSGRSTGPHLHFDVAECEFMHCRTLPVTFGNAGVASGELKAGQTYPLGKSNGK